MKEQDLIDQNPWWIQRDRIYEDSKVKVALNRKHPLLYEFKPGNFLVIGPRQTGKTTYLKLMIKKLIERKIDPKNILYFACDLLRDKKEIIEVIKTFDSLSLGKQKYIFLDEVTFVEKWEQAVKFMLDSPLLDDKYVYITGSSSLGLRKERFPGRRITIKKFLPLDFLDFCKLFGSGELNKAIEGKPPESNPKEIFKKGKELILFSDELRKLFNFYLQSGGYPKASFELMEEGKIREDTYETCYNSVIFDMTKVKRSEKITLSILLGILRRYGSKFSLNSIAKEMEIGSHLTVRDYLELLEGLFVLRNYHQIDPGKGVIMFRKERKVYFVDPFLYRTFTKYLRVMPDIPALVESLVGEHLMRNYRGVYFYSKKREVDFLIGDTGIEVKWQKGVDYRNFPPLGIKNRILLTKESFGYQERRNIVMIPVYTFLLLKNKKIKK